MDGSRYGLGVDLSVPYEIAIERVTEALKREGFGILTTIDVKATLLQAPRIVYLRNSRPSFFVYETAEGRSRAAAVTYTMRHN